MNIGRLSEEVCDECFVYRNKFKYRAYDGDEGVKTEFWQDSSDDENASQFLQPTSAVEENEMLLTDAAKNVEKAKIQREYSNMVSSHQKLSFARFVTLMLNPVLLSEIF